MNQTRTEMQTDTQQQVEQLITSRYKAGFYTDIESETVGAGLNEEVIAMISAMWSVARGSTVGLPTPRAAMSAW